MINSTNNISEKELVEKCIAFERQYQEIFYRKYANKMFNICLTYSENYDEASDILQEGFIKIFRNIRHFKFEGSLEGWVRKIIVNTALENYRKKTNEQQKISVYSDTIDVETESIFEDVEKHKIMGLVNRLPSKAQMVLKLYAIEGYGHKEIAGKMNISEGTSKSQLNRARLLLKQAINKINEFNQG